MHGIHESRHAAGKAIRIALKEKTRFQQRGLCGLSLIAARRDAPADRRLHHGQSMPIILAYTNHSLTLFNTPNSRPTKYNRSQKPAFHSLSWPNC